MKYLILSLLCIISACSMDGEPGSNSLTGIVIIGDTPTAAAKTAVQTVNATVALLDSENPKVAIQETTTDADGRYQFTNIPDGQYYLVTREEWNYGNIEENVSFNNGTNKTLDVTMTAFKKHSYDFQVDEDELYFYNTAIEGYSESNEFYYLEESKNVYTGAKDSKSKEYAVEIKDNSLYISDANTIIYKTDQLSSTPGLSENPKEAQALPKANKDYSYLPQSYTANNLDINTQQYSVVITDPNNKHAPFYGHLYLKDHLDNPIAQLMPNDISMIGFNNLSDGDYVFIAQAGNDYATHIEFSIPSTNSLDFFNFTLTKKVTVQFDHSPHGEFEAIDWFSFPTSKALFESSTLLYIPGITNIYSVFVDDDTKFADFKISVTDSADVIYVRDYPSGTIIDSIVETQIQGDTIISQIPDHAIGVWRSQFIDTTYSMSNVDHYFVIDTQNDSIRIQSIVKHATGQVIENLQAYNLEFGEDSYVFNIKRETSSKYELFFNRDEPSLTLVNDQSSIETAIYYYTSSPIQCAADCDGQTCDFTTGNCKECDGEFCDSKCVEDATCEHFGSSMCNFEIGYCQLTCDTRCTTDGCTDYCKNGETCNEFGLCEYPEKYLNKYLSIESPIVESITL